MGYKEMKIGKWDLSHLTQRERWFLLGGGLFVCILLLYFMLWAPLREKLDDLKQANAAERALNHWVKITSMQLQQFKAQGISIQAVKNEHLLSTLEDLLLQEKLSDYVESVQEREGKIVLNFKGMPFDRLMIWLEKIWRSYAVRVSQIHVTREETQGLVRGSLVLELS